MRWRDLSPMERLHAQCVPEPNSGCWLWLSALNPWGYGCILTDGKRMRANRASWELHYGPIPEDMHVCHKCDVASCVNPEHLFLGTHQDNMRDKVAKGRCSHTRGEKTGTSKLKVEQVAYIKASTERGIDLAAKFNVSPDAISKIRRGHNWAHIDAKAAAAV